MAESDGTLDGAGWPGAGRAVHCMEDSALWFDAVVLAGGRATRLGGADKPALVVGERSLLASVVSAAVGAGARRVIVVGPDRPGLRAAPGLGAVRDELSGLRAVREEPPGVVREEPPGPRVERKDAPGLLVVREDPPGLRVVREDPPGSGPVPALRRGLAEVSAPWVFLLAADLPFLRPVDLTALLAAARGPGAAEPAGSALLADKAAAGAVLASDALPGDEPFSGALLADESGRPQWLVSCWRSAVLRASADRYQGGSLQGLLRPLSPVILPPRAGQAGPPPWLDCDTEDDVRRARAWSDAPGWTGSDAPR